MLVELAVGDAYGAGFEYSEPDFVARHNTLGGYIQHPRHTGISPGDYTDDTQMTIAIAELLLSGEAWSAGNLAERFVQVFRRDRRDGYSTRFHALLRASNTGAELLGKLTPGNDRSGAAMRAGPIGLLPRVDEVLDHARTQALVTHDSPGGVESAQATALAVHYCYHRLGPSSGAATWVEQRLRAAGGQHAWAQPWQGPVGAQGVMSVHAALSALTNARSLRSLLHACIDYTGDVDTVATIALAAASTAADISYDLPLRLYNTLENGRYGRDYLADLDQRLLQHYPR
jgi:ADP-ribosyl-[dinitrogen reductase] hydrolase